MSAKDVRRGTIGEGRRPDGSSRPSFGEAARRILSDVDACALLAVRTLGHLLLGYILCCLFLAVPDAVGSLGDVEVAVLLRDLTVTPSPLTEGAVLTAGLGIGALFRRASLRRSAGSTSRRG